jgi:two-component system, NarL family, nitrate/nitrite response regulator NarL
VQLSTGPLRPQHPLRVLVVDDDTLVADVLAAVFRARWHADVDIVSDVESARAAVTNSDTFDLVLADFQLPGRSGIPFITDLVALSKPSPVVLISGKVGPQIIHSAIAAGARGYISKRIGVPQMLRRLEIVLSGETYVPPDVLVAGVGKKAAPSGTDLTKRERQVLNGVRKGLSNKEIARELELSDITVKLHVRSLLKKFSLTNRTRLAMMEMPTDPSVTSTFPN